MTGEPVSGLMIGSVMAIPRFSCAALKWGSVSNSERRRFSKAADNVRPLFEEPAVPCAVLASRIGVDIA